MAHPIRRAYGLGPPGGLRHGGLALGMPVGDRAQVVEHLPAEADEVLSTLRGRWGASDNRDRQTPLVKPRLRRSEVATPNRNCSIARTVRPVRFAPGPGLGCGRTGLLLAEGTADPSAVG